MEKRFNMEQAAKLMGYSKRSLHRRKSEGYFPPARIDEWGHPYYTTADIKQCCELLESGVGANGKGRRLYGGRSNRKQEGNRKFARAKKPVSPLIRYIAKRLGGYGIAGTSATPERIALILRELYPDADPPQDRDTVAEVSKVLRPPDSTGLDEDN